MLQQLLPAAVTFSAVIDASALILAGVVIAIDFFIRGDNSNSLGRLAPGACLLVIFNIFAVLVLAGGNWLLHALS